MLKYNNSNITKMYFDTHDLVKVYRNNAICYYKVAIQPKYRTISGETYCGGSTGYDKYVDVYSQVSYDGGETWETTATTPTLVEANSPDCGYITDYFRFISKGSGTFTFFANGSSTGNSLSYSLDSGSTWVALANGSTSPTVSNGDVIWWKGSNMTTVSDKGIGTFSATTDFDVEGNVMSLYYGDNFEGETDLTNKNWAFMNLFSGCTRVINAENLKLPATTLSTQCYCNMFNRANRLETPPKLSATTLAVGCYQNMFYSGKSLTTSESFLLPAQTLVKDCYRQMFLNCTYVNKITCLATSGINTNNSTNNWLQYASSSGTFTKDANTTWTMGNSGIPSNWTVTDYSG